jgi:4'-phosphopantetheinyl transferase
LKAFPRLVHSKALMDQFWSPASESFSLSEGDVQIWRAWLKRPPEQVDGLMAVLSEDERARAGRFHYAKDRSHFIAGRAILRTLLGRYLLLSPNEVLFTYSQHGRPDLDKRVNTIGLQFNLSHSEELAIFAFTRGRKLGIDLEYQRWLSDLSELAASCLSQNEFEIWSNLPTSQQQGAFYLLWTQKEAFLKAEGEGLSQPLESIELAFEQDTAATLENIRDCSIGECKWSATTFVPAPGYLASLFVSGEGWQLTCREYA